MLECEICLHGFNFDKPRPRSLPCGHTMCSSCITDILQTKAGCFDCPFCRCPFGDNPKTTSAFPETFIILRLLEAKNQDSDTTYMWGDSMRNNGKEKLEKLKDTELDGTLSCSMTCKEHLADLQKAKVKQDAEKQHLEQQRNDLLEELNRINEQEIQIDADLQQTEGNIAAGVDLLRHIESIQECIKSACSVVGVKMAAQDALRCYSATSHWTSTATSCNSGSQSPLGDQEFDSGAEASFEPSPSPPAHNNSELPIPIQNVVPIVDSSEPVVPSISVGISSNVVKNKGARSREDSPEPALSDVSLDRGLPFLSQSQLQSQSQMLINGISCLNIKVPPHERKVFVGGLHINTNEETLERYFSQYGMVIDVALKYDAETNRSKGYAFIEFTSPDMVDSVRRAQPHKIDGRTVDTKRAKPNPKHQMTGNRMYRLLLATTIPTQSR